MKLKERMLLKSIDHGLRPIIERILNYAKPESKKSELERLLTNILLYIKRVESNDLTTEQKRFPGVPHFHFLALAPSPQLASTFYDKIRIVHDYKIRSASRIQEILISRRGGSWPQVYSADQVKILNLVSNKPTLNVSQLSHLTDRSRPTITKILKQLRNSFGFRQGYVANTSKFKLSRFSVVFRTKSVEASQALEQWVLANKPPFIGSLVFDLYYRNGFLVFLVPSQQRAIRLFYQRADWLRFNFFQQIQIHHTFDLLWKARFDDYEVENCRWRIPEALRNYPHSLISKSIPSEDVSFQRCIRSEAPMRFSRVDYLLANSDVMGGPTIQGKREFLKQCNYNLSANAVWSHFKRLKESGAVVPYVIFAGAGLEDFICLSLSCDSEIQRLIKLLAMFLPFSYVYITDRGVALFFKRPLGWNAIVNRIIKETPKLSGVEEFMVVQQESQSGISLGYEIFNRWNEKRQYWEFSDEEI
jgi:hypothetical protein